MRQNESEKVKEIGKELRRNLRKDRRKRVNDVSIKIEKELKGNNVIEAYDILRGWYKKFSGRSEKPSLEDLASKREFYKDLFMREETEKENLDIEYEGNDVDYSIPGEKEISEALFRLKNRRAPGLTGITVEHLKEWYKLSHPEDEKVVDKRAERNWSLIIKITQKCFNEGKFPDAFRYGVLVLIPKDEFGGVRGIGLLETLHKLISSIINMRLTKSIKFCEGIHGFRRGRGCYTAIGEAKLKIQEATCNYKTLYQIYLDLKKAYDSVDREQVMRILEIYKVGPRIRRYIRGIWDEQKFVLRQAGFYSEEIDVERGVTQGDIDSPIIFNILVDAVVRKFLEDPINRQSTSTFYADDGRIENEDPQKLQRDIDIICGLFERVGLRTNIKKTKFMIIRGPSAPKALEEEVYERMCGKRKRGESESIKYGVWRKQITECDICKKRLKRGSLQRHMEQQHGIKDGKYLCRRVNTNRAIFRVRIERGKNNECPIPGCVGGAKDKFGMYRHFAWKHPEKDISIDDDGLLPKCPKCRMHCSDMEKHLQSKTCEKIFTRRRNEDLQDKQVMADEIKFYIQGEEIERVREFKYLGRILTNNDNDTKCIDNALAKTRRQWNCIGKMLKREGANAEIMGRFYITIVMSVLLYGSESWTITGKNLIKLKSFHNRALRYMTRKHIRKEKEGKWTYPAHEELRKICKLESIETYIQRRRGTLRRYLEVKRKEFFSSIQKVKAPSKQSNKILWWKQPWIDG